MATLEAVGFAPEAETEAGTGADPGADSDTDTGSGADEDPPGSAGRRLRLHHCPFREVAEHRPDIVCAIHLGLMRGTVETLRAPLTPESLEPFVTPHVCVATLRRTDAA